MPLNSVGVHCHEIIHKNVQKILKKKNNNIFFWKSIFVTFWNFLNSRHFFPKRIKDFQKSIFRNFQNKAAAIIVSRGLLWKLITRRIKEAIEMRSNMRKSREMNLLLDMSRWVQNWISITLHLWVGNLWIFWIQGLKTINQCYSYYIFNVPKIPLRVCAKIQSFAWRNWRFFQEKEGKSQCRKLKDLWTLNVLKSIQNRKNELYAGLNFFLGQRNTLNMHRSFEVQVSCTCKFFQGHHKDLGGTFSSNQAIAIFPAKRYLSTNVFFFEQMCHFWNLTAESTFRIFRLTTAQFRLTIHSWEHFDVLFTHVWAKRLHVPFLQVT